MKTFLATSDAARALGVTTATVRLIARRGELRVAARTESGIALFQRSDVERLAAKRGRRARRAGRAA